MSILNIAEGSTSGLIDSTYFTQSFCLDSSGSDSLSLPFLTVNMDKFDGNLVSQNTDNSSLRSGGNLEMTDAVPLLLTPQTTLSTHHVRSQQVVSASSDHTQSKASIDETNDTFMYNALLESSSLEDSENQDASSLNDMADDGLVGTLDNMEDSSYSLCDPQGEQGESVPASLSEERMRYIQVSVPLKDDQEFISDEFCDAPEEKVVKGDQECILDESCGAPEEKVVKG